VNLWLARHAAVDLAPGMCYGRLDPQALEQPTEDAARRLAGRLPPGLAVRSSPRLRCTALAERLARRRPDLAWTADNRLAEMDFGAWEGRSWDAIGPGGMSAWMADFAHHRPGGGECVSDFMARVGEAFAEARAAPRHTLWITHAGVVRAARLLQAGAAVPASASAWPAEGLAPGDFTVLALAPAR
jgi:alpha-ribazole phosphatase